MKQVEEVKGTSQSCFFFFLSSQSFEFALDRDVGVTSPQDDERSGHWLMQLPPGDSTMHQRSC